MMQNLIETTQIGRNLLKSGKDEITTEKLSHETIYYSRSIPNSIVWLFAHVSKEEMIRNNEMRNLNEYDSE